MEKISAVICELNPCHEGHKYIFKRAKEFGDTVIAIMSGNFVQRGEAAVYDKYSRAESALEAGADLVLELPYPWCAASTEFFASAAVEIAEKIGVDNLVFGSESGDKDALLKASEILKREEFNSAIPPDIRAAEYREKLLYETDPTLPSGLLSSANDILGIEYIKNLKKVNAVPYKRISCDSASSIRAKMKAGTIRAEGTIYSDKLFDLIFSKLRCSTESPIFTTAEASGGVGERLYKSANASKNGLHMLENAKTKQYTDARLRRAGLFYLTETNLSDLKEKPLFTNVLAFNPKGRAFLSSLRKSKDIVLITKPSDESSLSDEAKLQYSRLKRADRIYTLLTDKISDANYFLKHSPYIYKENSSN